MLFTFLAALAACQTTAMRPQLSRTKVSQKIASVGDLVSKISSPKESRAALQAAAGIVDGILAEAGNATEHMSDDDATLLRSVIDLVEKTIYGSMDSAHAADVKTLNDLKAAVEQCNVDITARQAADGDLGQLHQHVLDKQTELNRLQGVVDDKTQANATQWQQFDQHMQMIAAPPACPGLPARTMPSLDVYFEKSEYSIWFAAQQAAYDTARDKYTAADSALQAAIEGYNIQKAVRDVQYCDYKAELNAACARFDKCFDGASASFNEEVPIVTSDMNQRIEILKAGDTLVQQIKFLLAESKTRETPPSDTSRYTIAFPLLSVKADCDLTVLDHDSWVPQPTCSHQLLDGCSRGGNLYPAWGSPRMESDDGVAGEAVCCTNEGKATRNIREHQGLFNQGLSHQDCTTTSGIQLKNGKDTPSHTYHEAAAICDAAGLRLCRNQEELDTSCGTGCHLNFALAWVEQGGGPAPKPKPCGWKSLGAGWCREPNGSKGSFTVLTGETEVSCQAKCCADSECVAVEFHGSAGGKCELHKRLIDRISAHIQGKCLVKK